MQILMSFAGIALILLLAFILSTDRKAIRLRVVGAAFALQAGIAALVLGTSWGAAGLEWMANGVSALLGYSAAGTQFLFGPNESNPLANTFVIAALPVIVFFAALISILYYLGIMQQIIKWVGGALQAITGISKVESLASAANIFVGQSESPLVVKPYLAKLPPSQLFTIMSVGMAGVAGTILAAYAAMGIDIEFLLAAAFMSAPGGILMAKIIMPDPKLEPAGDVDLNEQGRSPKGAAAAALDGHVEDVDPHGDEEKPANLIMAAAMGAQTGVKLAVAVAAMVLAFVALVALANGILGGIGGWFGYDDLTFQQIVGYVFQPIMYLIGVPWEEANIAGGLFGTKVVLNEFVAFIDLGAMDSLSTRTTAIVTFALCGFANFSSIAIQMAVTGGLAPNQRPTIARLGLRALAAGSLANLMSAALAGLLLSF
ncbi:NupC/NupG family nucleoside CNT transporter [Sphingomicrobium sediminis]|uniref:NupC/NupG family nucleoside CNT transporter n=1 Tax=Sphingomicrobium sediminis TaxID=2950949 RepID=A0A9X2J3U1_9SPHN|nr:nucleoside transporter C-terminal domain-containing protein [Sphingomicrobium sediminis]MCM8556542.1 NupC/NupG family nucleoside CNT transporter [Sphingomicrobium sediminis]